MAWPSWQIDMHACRSTDLLSLSAYLEDFCFGRLGIWSLQVTIPEIHQFTNIMQNSETVAATFTSILWPKKVIKVQHRLVLHDRQHNLVACCRLIMGGATIRWTPSKILGAMPLPSPRIDVPVREEDWPNSAVSTLISIMIQTSITYYYILFKKKH